MYSEQCVYIYLLYDARDSKLPHCSGKVTKLLHCDMLQDAFVVKLLQI